MADDKTKGEYDPVKVVIEDTDAEVFDDKCSAQLKRMPKQTWTVLLAELCERFSYYGIKTVLVLYLVTISTAPTEDEKKSYAKAAYHAFSMVSYFTGVFGAMMADSLFGKFKTIFWSLVVYCIGEVILTLTSIPSIGNGLDTGPLIGLFTLAIAGGNIKPCMAAFGGDQLPQKDVGLITKFFNLFYMAVNVGAMLTMIVVPLMRTEIRCFGNQCYPVVFGVNCIIIILATVAFMAGSAWYVKKEPEGNMMIRVFKIIGCAMSEKRKTKGDSHKYQHWLYYAQTKYEKAEIDDVRALLRVLVMYIPLPVFWALFHQQGSSWTLQAQQMDGDLGGGGSLRSDQMQFFNPVLVLILIPFFDAFLYPGLQRCNLGLSPLKKMTIGMVLAAIAFAITGFIQIKIQDVQPLPVAPPKGQVSIDFVNVSPCEKVEIDYDNFYRTIIPYGKHSGHDHGQAGDQTFKLRGHNCYAKSDGPYDTDVTVTLTPDTRQTIFMDINDQNQMTAVVKDHIFPEVSVKKSNSRVRTIYAPDVSKPSRITLKYVHEIEKKQSMTFDNFTSDDSNYTKIVADEYQLVVLDQDTGDDIPVSVSERLKLGTFGAYTITLTRPMHEKSASKLVAHLYEDVVSTSVHRIWQLPQYIVITAGEVMFSVTGLEFAYSQAPPSMKSVLQACWLVTTAFGDLIVVILSLSKPVDGVEKEMFLYGGVMLVVAIIFAIMSYFYTYSDYSGNATKPEPVDETELKEKNLKNSESTDSMTHL
ncbi:solute carrier family 15 member 2-like isoform X2 [Clytia hemisphaerica]|uniref:Uncharacterized protein n=1 Tax=Clytia hemisphaerica TaxID=252671 RepID=A0A7M5UUJ5_9CNID